MGSDVEVMGENMQMRSEDGDPLYRALQKVGDKGGLTDVVEVNEENEPNGRNHLSTMQGVTYEEERKTGAISINLKQKADKSWLESPVDETTVNVSAEAMSGGTPNGGSAKSSDESEETTRPSEVDDVGQHEEKVKHAQIGTHGLERGMQALFPIQLGPSQHMRPAYVTESVFEFGQNGMIPCS